jgi:hypothetical protein
MLRSLHTAALSFGIIWFHHTYWSDHFRPDGLGCDYSRDHHVVFFFLNNNNLYCFNLLVLKIILKNISCIFKQKNILKNNNDTISVEYDSSFIVYKRHVVINHFIRRLLYSKIKKHCIYSHTNTFNHTGWSDQMDCLCKILEEYDSSVPTRYIIINPLKDYYIPKIKKYYIHTFAFLSLIRIYIYPCTEPERLLWQAVRF